jgi:hypothetical protein
MRHPPDIAALRDHEALLILACEKDGDEMLRENELVRNPREVARVVCWAKVSDIFLSFS